MIDWPWEQHAPWWQWDEPCQTLPEPSAPKCWRCEARPIVTDSDIGICEVCRMDLRRAK